MLIVKNINFPIIHQCLPSSSLLVAGVVFSCHQTNLCPLSLRAVCCLLPAWPPSQGQGADPPLNIFCLILPLIFLFPPKGIFSTKRHRPVLVPRSCAECGECSGRRWVWGQEAVHWSYTRHKSHLSVAGPEQRQAQHNKCPLTIPTTEPQPSFSSHIHNFQFVCTHFIINNSFEGVSVSSDSLRVFSFADCILSPRDYLFGCFHH